MLAYYDEKPDLSEVSEEVFIDSLRGALVMDMLIYAKQRGFNAKHYSGSLEDLKAKVRDDKPIILFIKQGIGRASVGHYIVIVGFDDEEKVVIAHTGKESSDSIGYKRLLRIWEKTGYSTLLITPKEVTTESSG